MFTLLNPPALLALLGLLVPVAIHLWNRRPGREVAVGSLRWLAAGATRRLRNLKLEQLALLALRAAVLAALAVAGASPVWRQARPAGRGQVLLSPAVAGTPALAALRPAVDSLRRRGYGLRWLAPGFPAVPAGQWTGDSGTAPGAGSRSPAGGAAPVAESFLWARVQQAAGAFAGQPLHVVTSARLGGFRGGHPPFPAQLGLRWQLLPASTEAVWLHSAALRDDSLRLRVGQSTESRTTFRAVAVPQPVAGGRFAVAGLPGLRYELGADGRAQVLADDAPAAAGRAARPVTVRTQPLRVAVYGGPGRGAEARSVRAALRAAALGLPVPVAVTTAGALAPAADDPNWLFWLADAPLPAAWQAAVGRGTQLWQEAAGPGRADTVFLAPNAAADAALVTLFRRDTARLMGSVPLWTDGRGRPVLSRRPRGRGAVYHLHTRLAPAWSELADSPALPALLLALLHADPAADPRDQRSLDPAQLPAATMPVPAPLSHVSLAFREFDLRPWLVLLAGLLFAVERALARRRETPLLTTTT